MLKNPAYYAGTALVSAATFVGSGLIGKGVKAARALVAARDLDKIEDIAALAAKEAGYDVSGVQAVKITKAGEEIPLRPGPLGTMLETKQVPLPTLKYSPVIDIPGTPISVKMPNIFGLRSLLVKVPTTTDIFRIESGLEEVGAVNVKTGKTLIGTGPLSQAEMEHLAGQKIVPYKSLQKVGEGVDIAEPTVETIKGTDTPAKSITQIWEREARGLKPAGAETPVKAGEIPLGYHEELGHRSLAGRTPDDFIVTSTGRVLPGQAKHTGDIVEFGNKDLAKRVEEMAKRDRQVAEAGEALAADISSFKGPGRPFDLGSVKAAAAPPLEKTSGTPLEMQAAYEFDRSLAAINKTIDKMITEGSAASSKAERAGALAGGGALGLGGGAGLYSSSKETLGFRGATGAERVGADMGVDYAVRYLPGSSLPSISKGGMDLLNLVVVLTHIGNRFDYRHG